MIYAVAVFSPLLGSIIAGLLGRAIGDRASQVATVGLMIVAAIAGDVSFYQLVWGGAPVGSVEIGQWIASGDLDTRWALRFDTLSVAMVAMVTTVSTLIHLYSVGYMSHDSSIPRFMSYLSFFTFAMLMLVTANNLVQLFFGWEGVGVASYLLIGFWYHKPSACAAAIKAFIVNRVGDLFFIVGIAVTFYLFRTIWFPDILAPGAIATHMNATFHIFGQDMRIYELIGTLLFLGAMGKSAQIFLHTWLPDAMEGPTPVSALIHAATMVTAGVFLMARMSPLMEYAPNALHFVTLIGATTALFAATIGCVQNDIKRIIAYSTCSLLGYMFMAAGVGAYQASIFHLITHAFFKALLFLSAGSVIHAMSDEQDIRKMGGLFKKIPFTGTVMWIGSLALAGIPFFAGYYSKDAIIEAVYAAHTGWGDYGFFCGCAAAFLTAFYSWRLLILTFHGETRVDHHTWEHVHESPWVMTLPLGLLALGALFAGFLLHNMFIGDGRAVFWGAAIFNGPGNHILATLEDRPAFIGILPTLLGVSGIALAYVMYVFVPALPEKLATAFRPVYLFLLNKWYFDELYDAIFVKPTMWLARFLWKVGDAEIIDGVPNGLASLTSRGSAIMVKLQTGSIAVYAFTMLIGLVTLITIFLVLR